MMLFNCVRCAVLAKIAFISNVWCSKVSDWLDVGRGEGTGAQIGFSSCLLFGSDDDVVDVSIKNGLTGGGEMGLFWDIGVGIGRG